MVALSTAMCTGESHAIHSVALQPFSQFYGAYRYGDSAEIHPIPLWGVSSSGNGASAFKNTCFFVIFKMNVLF